MIERISTCLEFVDALAEDNETCFTQGDECPTNKFVQKNQEKILFVTVAGIILGVIILLRGLSFASKKSPA